MLPSPRSEGQFAALRAQLRQQEEESESGSEAGEDELDAQAEAEPDELAQAAGKEEEDRARQEGIKRAEILVALLLFFGTDEKLAEDDFIGYCARIAATDHPLARDVHVFKAKVRSVITEALQVVTEGETASTLDMRLFLVLRTVAQCTKSASRQTEYGSEVKSLDEQLNSRLHDIIARSPFASEDDDSYQMANLMAKRHLQGGVEGLRTLAAMNDSETLHFLCSAREALAGHLNMEVVPLCLLDGEMLRFGNVLASELFGNSGCTFASSSIAPHYFTQCVHHCSLRRSLYSMCALVGMARTGMLVECIHETRQAGHDDCLGYSRLASSPEWMELGDLVSSLRGVYRERRANRSLVTDTNASLSAFYRVFANWFDGCTHHDARFHCLQRAFSAACVTIGAVPRKLKSLWAAYTAKAGVRSLCLWGAAEFACSAALSLTGKVIPLHAACMLVLSGAIGAVCHKEITGPFVFTASASAMMRQAYREIGDLPVPDARATDRVARFTPSTCGYALTLKDMVEKNKTRFQNAMNNYTECFVRACLVHLARTEGCRAVVTSSAVSCLPSERNKQARRIFVRAMMAAPACAVSDCFQLPGKHFLASSASSEHAYKYNDIMGGGVIIAILYPIASKALKDTVNLKFAHLQGLSKEEQKKFSVSTVECLDEFLLQLRSLADCVFDKETRLIRQGPNGERIKNLNWAELVFDQQFHFIRSFCNAVRGSSTVFSRICNATSRHVKRAGDADDDDDEDLWEDVLVEEHDEDDEFNAEVAAVFG
tara:strand:+ start:1264 stop:3576 length:2313 start_codon:yes stop_codon:yes gene_type:complete